MLRVALTGGIATGKTYVLGRFRAVGVPVIDADDLVHEAFAAGSPLIGAVKERFGIGVIGERGEVDRHALAAIVFADPAARIDLEAIVHPAVYAVIERWFENLAPGGAPFAVADIPLLYETGHAARFDRVVVTACDPGVQLHRVMSRDNLSQTEARQRIAAQWPLARKIGRADFTIRTDGTTGETDRQVERVIATLRDAAARA